MAPHNDTSGYCADHKTRGEQLECAREQVNALSADVRVLATKMDALMAKMDAHLAANDLFMPRINDLITRFAVVEQRIRAIESDNKTVRGAVVSIIVALIVAGITAAVNYGG